MSNNEQHKGDAAKRKVELEEKRASLKAQKEKLEKELQNICNEISEKERAINALNKTNSANRERKPMPDLKALSPGVLGYVKDQLTILDEDKYFVPVMNILSSVCNHVVVRSRADARHVIQYYEKNKIG
jgi:chromosome segregation ATPase